MDAGLIVCPRCHQEAHVRFFGPCDACRHELAAKFQTSDTGGEVAERVSFEPKMNVTPNFIATKD